MTTLSLLPAALAAASALFPSGPPAGYDLVANGRDPDWFLTAGSGHISLGIGALTPWHRQFDEGYRFLALAYSEADGVRRWEATATGRHIVVENRRGPCHVGDSWGSENVRVRLDEREFIGCGDYSVVEGH
jgi:hypothetical protein